MSTPATPVKKPGLLSRAVGLYSWVVSANGRKDLGAAVAAVTALYVALHRAGVL